MDGLFVQANQNNPTGIQIHPINAGGSRASGGANPAVLSVARLYLRSRYMVKQEPNSCPTATPRKDSPLTPCDQWRCCPKTIGNAVNVRYRVPYTAQSSSALPLYPETTKEFHLPMAAYIDKESTIGSRTNKTHGLFIATPNTVFALFSPRSISNLDL